MFIGKFQGASFEQECWYIVDLTERNRMETSQLIAISRDISPHFRLWLELFLFSWHFPACISKVLMAWKVHEGADVGKGVKKACDTNIVFEYI